MSAAQHTHNFVDIDTDEYRNRRHAFKEYHMARYDRNSRSPRRTSHDLHANSIKSKDSTTHHI